MVSFRSRFVLMAALFAVSLSHAHASVASSLVVENVDVRVIEGVEAPTLRVDVDLYSLRPTTRRLDGSLETAKQAIRRAKRIAREAGLPEETGATASVPLPADIALAYITAVTKARNAVSDALEDASAIAVSVTASRGRIASASQTAQEVEPVLEALPLRRSTLSERYGALSHTTLAATLFELGDSLTDTLVTVGEIQSLDSVIDTLVVTIDSAYDGVYRALPGSIQTALASGDSAAATANSAIGAAKIYIFSVIEYIEWLVERSEPTIFNTGSNCEVKEVDGVHIYYGNQNANTCSGTSGPDIFHMRGGNDTANGYGSHDVLHMASLDDYGYGGRGLDRIYGGMENDHLYGNEGPDWLQDSKDVADGDWLYGGKGSDDGDIQDGDTFDSFYMQAGNDKDPAYDVEVACAPSQGCHTGSDWIDKGD